MNDPTQSTAKAETSKSVWSRKAWWLLSLAVLLLLLGILYALVHMSAADSEMYPTSLRSTTLSFRFC